MKHVIMIVLAFLLVACGAGPDPLVADEVARGAVYVAQPGTTLYWMNQAFAGAPNTQILAKEGSYFVMWAMPGGQGTGFTLAKVGAQAGATPVIDWLKATGGKGNIGNAQDMKVFVQYMKDEGWKPITASQVPQVLKNNIAGAWRIFKAQGQAALAQLASYSKSMISIVVMPIAVIPMCPEEAPGCTYTPYEPTEWE